ncbi:MAG: acyl carrier protein [Candidatus Cloacimonetes bacterium]|nr:acyl carrier protein [Candidatus Cloacimonadota bacterium]
MSMETIMQIIADNLTDVPQLTETTSLRAELNVDSLDVIMIINALEDEFSLTIDEDDFVEVDTPAEIFNLLKSKYSVE